MRKDLHGLTLSTDSGTAVDAFDRATQSYLKYRTDAGRHLAAALKADPNFALAYIFIAYNSNDPAEANAAREKAKLLAPKATPGERLVIQWIAGAKENNFIVAISAMTRSISSVVL